ncbi:hypothetical protein PCL_12825 [Purpureocillium lilacinum]|uniref:Uncharacterized protein n=1 Tax=Purpureocillium lilacinum TaxID=33203 RepID=A0A2U3E7G8_PURLI|nr:hypothetical protein PCL_12825 [Purpureocillium lilacinum]
MYIDNDPDAQLPPSSTLTPPDLSWMLELVGHTQTTAALAWKPYPTQIPCLLTVGQSRGQAGCNKTAAAFVSPESSVISSHCQHPTKAASSRNSTSHAPTAWPKTALPDRDHYNTWVLIPPSRLQYCVTGASLTRQPVTEPLMSTPSTSPTPQSHQRGRQADGKGPWIL